MNITREELVDRFRNIWSIHNEKGHIVWRRGTGDNVELLHIRVNDQRRGYGNELVKQMILQLQNDKPYSTVFGFTRTNNEVAINFYRKLGFTLSKVDGIYLEQEALVFSQKYDELLNRFINE